MWMALMQQCALSLYGLSAGIYMHSLADVFDPVVVAVVIVTVFYLANLMGASFSSRAGVWLLELMLIGFSVFIVTGFGHIEWNAYPEPLPNGFTQLVSAAALLTFATMGSYGVAELGREMKNPGRDIPIAMIGGTPSSSASSTSSSPFPPSESCLSPRWLISRCQSWPWRSCPTAGGCSSSSVGPWSRLSQL